MWQQSLQASCSLGNHKKHFLQEPKDCWSFGGNNRASEQPFFLLGAKISPK
jgi:hypothetical protein